MVNILCLKVHKTVNYLPLIFSKGNFIVRLEVITFNSVFLDMGYFLHNILKSNSSIYFKIITAMQLVNVQGIATAN